MQGLRSVSRLAAASMALLALSLGAPMPAVVASPPTRADDSVFHISRMDALGLSAKRSELINFIWGVAGFPGTKQPSLHQPVPSPVANLANLESVEALRIDMDAGEYTLAYHFTPAAGKRNRLVIVHQGHACILDDGTGSGNTDRGIQRSISALLVAGFGVLAISMPHFSPANSSLGDPGNCNKGDHDSIFNLSVTGSPLKFFVEPVAVGINYLSSRYQDFNMMGLSGGGWTTTLYAAIDTRVTLSFPVAGSVPLYLRVEPYSHDLEQFLPALYGAFNPPVKGIAGYLDLYLLGSRGFGRNQIQILNRHDDCCFGEPEHNASVLGVGFEPAVRIYESRVKSAAPAVPGFFRTWIDEASPIHTISDNAINNVILLVLDNSSQANAVSTTIRSAVNLCLDVPDFGRSPQNNRSRWSGLCLDVPDFGRPPQNNDYIQVYQCNGGTNQQFNLNT